MATESTEVFVYTAGAIVPMDVVRARVHPSVTAIPDEAFKDREHLEEVELCGGLVEIGELAFNNCISLKRVRTPSTLISIARYAFSYCKQLEEIELCVGC